MGAGFLEKTERKARLLPPMLTNSTEKETETVREDVTLLEGRQIKKC